jgi:NTP pyrophosphatase (non-canonical NTP hydrolase)
MNLDELARELNATAVEKGFWNPLLRMESEDDFIFYAKQLCMIHSEVTEAMEALRKEQGLDKFVEELADLIIRTLDLWAGMDRTLVAELPSLHDTLLKKAGINKERPTLHGVRG